MSHLVGSYSDACILHIKTDTLIIDFKAKADFTGKREFTSIGEEVGDNLRNAVPVFFNNQSSSSLSKIRVTPSCTRSL